jgi:glycosyltransferase involved in cell wall biosynthesis
VKIGVDARILSNNVTGIGRYTLEICISRKRGTSNFRFKDLVSLAIDGVLNHSIVPLRMATFFGISISIITVLAIIGYSLSKLLFGVDRPAGFTTLAVLVLAGISVNALFLGIIGEYLSRIYQQVKKRPLVIVETELDDNNMRSNIEADVTR